MGKITWTLVALCAALVAVSARAEGWKKGACKTDAQSLCKDVKPGQGRIINCLMGKSDQVQDADCKSHIQKIKEREDAIKQACSSDISAKCSGMDFGTGLGKCLHKNHKDLSGACKDSMHRKKGGKSGGDQGGSETRESQD